MWNRKISYIASVLIIIGITLILSSCLEKDPNKTCPPFSWIPVSPYNDPIWHPSGKIIGFNHTPIKEIRYEFGYDCPLQASYIYDYSNSGFWLIDSNGQNLRKALPFFLNTPSWSPDGKWVIFSNGNIYKMPFDGECFDTTSITQLTTSGNNYYPTWSSEGNYIAFDNTECGSLSSPIPPNSCGILIMDSIGNNKSFIIQERRFPYWGRSEDTIYYSMFYYDLINKRENTIIDNVKINFLVVGRPLFNSQKRKIFFLGKFLNVPGNLKLYSIEPSGENFKIISDDPIMSFSWSTDGRIVYLLSDNLRIDKEKGTLWIMNEDGSNKHQLTTNDFITSFK